MPYILFSPMDKPILKVLTFIENEEERILDNGFGKKGELLIERKNASRRVCAGNKYDRKKIKKFGRAIIETIF